jgi:hypothetical protein
MRITVQTIYHLQRESLSFYILVEVVGDGGRGVGAVGCGCHGSRLVVAMRVDTDCRGKTEVKRGLMLRFASLLMKDEWNG